MRFFIRAAGNNSLTHGKAKKEISERAHRQRTGSAQKYLAPAAELHSCLKNAGNAPVHAPKTHANVRITRFTAGEPANLNTTTASAATSAGACGVPPGTTGDATGDTAGTAAGERTCVSIRARTQNRDLPQFV
ncbi:MAG: hypothetical protein LBR07_08185 [Puniceicoccales bacterium]|jgi:hypothetical protein|nr:hypothetical protein [Puniceicoccales bacterium]